jgi:hypothetical protein
MVEDILAPIPMMLIYVDQNGMLYYQPLQPSSRVAGHEQNQGEAAAPQEHQCNERH